MTSCHARRPFWQGPSSTRPRSAAVRMSPAPVRTGIPIRGGAAAAPEVPATRRRMPTARQTPYLARTRPGLNHARITEKRRCRCTGTDRARPAATAATARCRMRTACMRALPEFGPLQRPAAVSCRTRYRAPSPPCRPRRCSLDIGAGRPPCRPAGRDAGRLRPTGSRLRRGAPGQVAAPPDGAGRHTDGGIHGGACPAQAIFGSVGTAAIGLVSMRPRRRAPRTVRAAPRAAPYQGPEPRQAARAGAPPTHPQFVTRVVLCSKIQHF